jgi:hypothetical protein
MKYDIIGGGYDQEDEYQESYTIGKLLEELENSTANSVRLIGTDYTLGSLMSWRGSYDIPAFDYEVGYKTPQQLAAEIRDDLRDIHTGYKGGDYKYSEQDTFYISAYGSAGEHQVVAVKTEQSILYLCTKIVPY